MVLTDFLFLNTHPYIHIISFEVQIVNMIVNKAIFTLNFRKIFHEQFGLTRDRHKIKSNFYLMTNYYQVEIFLLI